MTRPSLLALAVLFAAAAVAGAQPLPPFPFPSGPFRGDTRPTRVGFQTETLTFPPSAVTTQQKIDWLSTQVDEIAHAVVPAGGAVVYLGSTIHFAGTNSTDDEWRRGVHVSYTLGWLRTEENNTLGVPPRVARELSPEAQALLGYAIHDAIADGGGYLGMVRMRDPMELLSEGLLE